ncbi:hypothetical protein [Aliarcobacter butzleri]|uniref:hypothetical protein n=1 Tax=Aliarcobacter butzleri TaxID=28197 RepID=UPI0021B5BEDF|nr:hypothetical protein [Aliarcobacter butzleri]MCT7642622.1 hypothetical protein [Aliarcobacter butzleri]
MIVVRTIANRQLTQYNSDDKNINVTKYDFMQELFEEIYNNPSTTINNERVEVKQNGETRRIDFLIEDIILNKKYEVYFARSPRELRLQLRTYVVDREIIPGDIVTLYVEYEHNNYNLKIKSETIYKYVLERKTVEDNRYRVFIDKPENTNNAGITVTENTKDYLNKFGIKKTDEQIPFGKGEKVVMFDGYKFSNCNTKYIGVPYDFGLEVDCFDEIEEIL